MVRMMHSCFLFFDNGALAVIAIVTGECCPVVAHEGHSQAEGSAAPWVLRFIWYCTYLGHLVTCLDFGPLMGFTMCLKTSL